jgi:alanyl-tRNA synthetase
MKERALHADAASLAAASTDGIVVARADGRSGDELRSLAGLVRHRTGGNVVVLGGATPDGTAAIAAATDGSVDAVGIVRTGAGLIGGGGGGSAELALAGGRTPGGLDEALEAIRAQLVGS